MSWSSAAAGQAGPARFRQTISLASLSAWKPLNGSVGPASPRIMSSISSTEVILLTTSQADSESIGCSGIGLRSESVHTASLLVLAEGGRQFAERSPEFIACASEGSARQRHRLSHLPSRCMLKLSPSKEMSANLRAK